MHISIAPPFFFIVYMVFFTLGSQLTSFCNTVDWGFLVKQRDCECTICKILLVSGENFFLWQI